MRQRDRWPRERSGRRGRGRVSRGDAEHAETRVVEDDALRDPPGIVRGRDPGGAPGIPHLHPAGAVGQLHDAPNGVRERLTRGSAQHLDDLGSPHRGPSSSSNVLWEGCCGVCGRGRGASRTPSTTTKRLLPQTPGPRKPPERPGGVVRTTPGGGLVAGVAWTRKRPIFRRGAGCGGCPARSRGRGREREPRRRVLQHGGDPLGRLGPFFLEAPEFGVEVPSLLA